MDKIKQVILNTLEVLMKEYPEQRFGQILWNYYLQYVNDEQDPFYVTDEKSLEILEKSIDSLSH